MATLRVFFFMAMAAWQCCNAIQYQIARAGVRGCISGAQGVDPFMAPCNWTDTYQWWIMDNGWSTYGIPCNCVGKLSDWTGTEAWMAFCSRLGPDLHGRYQCVSKRGLDGCFVDIQGCE